MEFFGKKQKENLVLLSLSQRENYDDDDAVFSCFFALGSLAR